VEPSSGKIWLIDAGPDLREQLHHLCGQPVAEKPPEPAGLSGIFLTHGHIGHYLGLAQLGREVMGTRGLPVHVLPRMRRFLKASGPWSQLIRLGNIELRDLEAGAPARLAPRLSLIPLAVPHRAEFTETAAFHIQGPARSVAYIPDIDAWDEWETPLESLLARVDRAYLDGTFYGDGELPPLRRAEVPHPRIEQTLALLAHLPPSERSKVRFFHLNHTNPALQPESQASRVIAAAGCGVAVEGEITAL